MPSVTKVRRSERARERTEDASMAWRMPHKLLDRSTRCHLRLRRRRAPRPRARELGTARASACVDGEALRHVGQPNVTASPRLAALARLKYHSNNSVSELSGERRANATGPGDSGPARFNSFCAENPFYHDSVLSHIVPRSIEASNFSRGLRSFEGATHDHP